MIRLADDLEVLKKLCDGSPFGCPIISAAEAYGVDKLFAQFWSDGHAAYSKLDGVVRICGEIEDPEEAVAFLGAIGAELIVCEQSVAKQLKLHVADHGVVLYKELLAQVGSPLSNEVSVRSVYDVLHECDMVGEFEPFYLDVSHRVRHNTAICSAVYSENKMAAASVTVFGAGCALITAVGVRAEYRRQGFGTQVMKKTESRLSGCVYLFRAENENERFYETLGYRPCGIWCTGTLQ